MDKNRVATVDVGSNNQVTVTVPNLGEFLSLYIEINLIKHKRFIIVS